MERTVALKKLGKLLGKNLGYRVNPKAPTPEERDAAKAALPSAIEQRNRLKEQCDARHKAILAVDEQFQRLLAERKAASELVDKLSSTMRHKKITVGISSGLFFHVKAEGDNWQEIVDKITIEKVAA